MEPITLCGAVIVAVSLWEELEPLVIKVARTIYKSATMTTLMSLSKAPKAGGVISPCGCYSYHTGRGLSYRIIRS